MYDHSQAFFKDLRIKTILYLYIYAQSRPHQEYGFWNPLMLS